MNITIPGAATSYTPEYGRSQERTLRIEEHAASQSLAKPLICITVLDEFGKGDKPIYLPRAEFVRLLQMLKDNPQ